jgi:hypothetical protein
MTVVGNKTNGLGELNPGKVKVKSSGTTVIIAENLNRNGLEIVNGSANAVYLYPGKAAVVEEGIYLAKEGGSWNGMVGEMLWTGAVNGIAVTSEVTIQVLEV